jgi:GcrA cell cycle regulator
MPRINWTEERLALLRRLVAEKKTASQIAAVIGCTRNAVSGKANKIGLRLESNFWRPEKVERLLALIADGRYADEIAIELECKRGAVYDKAYHLGVKIAVKRSGPTRSPSNHARAFQHGAGCVNSGKPTPPRSPITTGPTADSLNVRMWDPAFKGNCCAWATGEDAGGFLFCAAKKLPGFPYCRPHAQAAYRPAPPRPPSAVKDSARREPREDEGEPKPLDFGRAA